MDQDGNAIAGIFFLSLEDFLSSSDYHRLQELVKAVGPGDTIEIISRFPRREIRESDHGEYYTPDHDVDFMSRLAIAVYLERAGIFKGFKEMRHPAFHAMFDPPSLDKFPHTAVAAIIEHLERAKVLDPACGAGVFLSRILAISMRLLDTIRTRNGHENDKDLERDLNLARSMLHGIDINADALVATKMNIAWTLAEYHQATKETMYHILETMFSQDMKFVHADFLLQDIESLDQFDIIIGNPPYIRQESITLPGAIHFHQGTPVLRDRRAYKARIEAILEPFFPEKRLPSRMSDYYVYFFFKAIPLLREGGCLSFLVSKSWLDAKFGRQLREAIASDMMIDFIIDPGEKRFDQAEINTLVVACSKPQLYPRTKETNRDDNDENSLAIVERYVATNVARFIRFLNPMAGIGLLTKATSMLRGTPVHQGGSLSSMAKDIVKDPISRVFPVHQGDLIAALASRGSNRQDETRGLISGSWKAAFLNG
ncbi:N-6 DNA methylase, partial [Candidatus Bathyarchaeota archaeon]|nr:N-6 DNA methylase [Candidatus Bathyarchaeota archaeon]